MQTFCGLWILRFCGCRRDCLQSKNNTHSDFVNVNLFLLCWTFNALWTYRHYSPLFCQKRFPLGR